MAEVLDGLSPETHGVAVALAGLPEAIRGFGHVKAKSVAEARLRRDELLHAFRSAHVPRAAASNG
jgi:indolepyruvate ferredoxin oxidoreductase